MGIIVSYLSLNSILIIVEKGTGINIYNVIYKNHNLSITVDGGSSSSVVYDGSRCWWTPAPANCYNTSVFSTQSLTYATHTLNITLLSYGTDQTWVWFDFAVISSPTQSSSSVIPSSTEVTTPSIQRSSYVPLNSWFCARITEVT